MKFHDENTDWQALSQSHYAERFQASCNLYLSNIERAIDEDAAGEQTASFASEYLAGRHMQIAEAIRAEFDTEPVA